MASRTVGTGLANGTADTTSCLKSGPKEKEGDVDTVLAASELKFGTLCFSSCPKSSFFIGQEYMDEFIKRSVPNIPSEERGSSTSFSRKLLYSSICSPDSRIKNAGVGNRFLQFLKGFKDGKSKEPYYKGLVLLMIYVESPIMKVQFKDIKDHDFNLAAEICYFYERVRQDLSDAAKSFISEFSDEFEAICSKKFTYFNNVTVCIDGLPEADRFLSVEAFSKLPGMHFSEPRTICSGASSMTIADTTPVGRVIGLDLLQHIFEAHHEKKTWNGQLNRRNTFVKNRSEVEIRAPYYHKYTDAAALNDLASYVDDFMPLYKLDKIGMPPFFSNLGKSLREFKPPILHFSDYVRRFQQFALAHLALKASMRRVALYSGLYRIRQTRHIRGLLKAILMSTSFEEDWRDEILLKLHPILSRVFNYKKNDKKSGTQEKKHDSRFSNSPDGTLLCVRHTNEHGPDGPDSEVDEEIGGRPEAEPKAEPKAEEDPIQLLSDLDLLYSHCLQSYLPDILRNIIDAEDVPLKLKIMLDEVLEDYNRPENLNAGSSWVIANSPL